MKPNRMTRPRSLALCPLGILLATVVTTPATAAPPNIDWLNIQPVDAPAGIGDPYDPVDPAAGIYLEPTQAADLLGHRLNLDLSFQSGETDWIRLDELYLRYIGEVSELAVMDDELVGLPSDDGRELSILRENGWSVTGLMVLHDVNEDDLTKQGQALDMLTYNLDGEDRTIVVGQRDMYVEPPVGDGYHLYQGFLTQFSDTGKLTDALVLPAESIQVVEDASGSVVIAGRALDSTPETSSDNRLFVGSVIHANRLPGGSWNLVDPALDTGFGGNGTGYRTISLVVGGQDCNEDIYVKDATRVSTPYGLTTILVVGALCNGSPRTLLVALKWNGLVESRLLDRGLAIVPVPSGDSHPVGVVPGVTSNVVRVGVGTYDPAEFGLAAIDLDDGQATAAGWAFHALYDYDSHPTAMAVDAQNRVVMGGYIEFGPSQPMGLMRFDEDGAVDMDFGVGGVIRHYPSGLDGRINDVVVRADGTYAVTGEALPPEGFRHVVTTVFDDMAAIWEHQVVGTSGGEWTHLETDISPLERATLREVDLIGRGAAIAEDSLGRLAFAGEVVSAHGDGGLPYLLPTMVATGRYVPVSTANEVEALDSRRWMRPGAKQNVVVPEDRDLTYEQPGGGTLPPGALTIGLQFREGDPVQRMHDLVVFEQAIVDPGYLFPFAPSTVDADEAVEVTGHHFDHHHRHSSASRFAYDMKFRQWTGSAWSLLVDGGDKKVNEDHLAWHRPVRALRDGWIVRCQRGMADNSAPEVFDSEGANYVRIVHYSGPDLARSEVVDFWHLAEDTIPEALCPEEDVDLDSPIYVEEGQIIGLVGNSGSSAKPHLHVQMATEGPALPGDPSLGGRPLLFRDVIIGDPKDAMGAWVEPPFWFEVSGRAPTSGTLAIATE